VLISSLKLKLLIKQLNMQERKLIKRITIEYSLEESSEEGSSSGRIHKQTVEESFLSGTKWETDGLKSYRSEYLC